MKTQITRIANEVNAQMDKEENFLKMYKIQASFIGNVKCLVKEGRVFVREGALIKMCRKVSDSLLPSRPACTTRPSPGPSPAPARSCGGEFPPSGAQEALVFLVQRRARLRIACGRRQSRKGSHPRRHR